MLTSMNKTTTDQVRATTVEFDKNIMRVKLSDGREVSLPMDQIEWLKWLAQATPEARAKWSLEPGGYAIYWEELDDGFEVCHLLTLEPLV